MGRRPWQLEIARTELGNDRSTSSGPTTTLQEFMPRRRRHCLLTTFCVVLSLLFSQLALARYVCPAEADAAAMAAMMASGEPCSGMDQAQPVLCHQHSAGAAQSFEAVKVPAPSLPAIVQVLGGFNRSTQHRVTRRILGSRSAPPWESSSPTFCVACCSRRWSQLEARARPIGTGQCP